MSRSEENRSSAIEVGGFGGRSPLMHLLHALNQPLTGLQCSLELASAKPLSTSDYVRVVRESLGLTSRMRILVEALRELGDANPATEGRVAEFRLDTLLSEVAEELRPLAEAKNLQFTVLNRAPLPVRASQPVLENTLFRLLEAVLSLADERSSLHIQSRPEIKSACLVIGWEESAQPEFSPFSRQELGLLMARSSWERSGGKWVHERDGDRQTCTLRMPLASYIHETERNGELR